MTDEHHLLIAHVAQVLLRTNGSALCVRRQPDAALTPGQLTVIGGHVQADEPLDHAARRKVEEEAGVSISSAHPEFCGLVHQYAPRGHDRITAVFVAQSWTGEPHNTEPDEDERLFWVSTEKPPPDCHPHTATIFQLLTEGPSYRALDWPISGGTL
ncbi:NUDIX domain-containing protein [Streptomyces sp. BE230]|uniref:NUDIX domain-containing protein n=1 Tax=Streptomyces sp. BE230 TaxID=3002526 RepID=UPI002ED57EF7|nr:NUDIX domain-containing protein [Streptomyces sp. BE230]